MKTFIAALLAAALFACGGIVCAEVEKTVEECVTLDGYIGYLPDIDAALSEDTSVEAVLYKRIYDGLLRLDAEIDISDLHLPYVSGSNYVINLYAQVCFEHPELYYVYATRFTSSYYISPREYAALTPVYTENDPDVIAATRKKIEEALDRLVSLTDPTMTDAEKVIVVHDAIVSETAYDTTLAAATAKDLLLDHTAVCQGYADTFYAAMVRLGIPCGFVNGDRHVWNAVYIDGAWYHVDCTFDDPCDPDRGENIPGLVKHEYALIGNDRMWQHRQDFTKLDNCGTAYDGAFWRETDSAVVIAAGQWYYIDDDEKTLEHYNTDTGETETLYRFGNWPHYLAGYAWSGTYSGLVKSGGKLYFNEYDAVYAMPFDSRLPAVVYRHEDEVNCSLYGLAASDGILYAAAGTKEDPRVRTPVPVLTFAAPKDTFHVLCRYNKDGAPCVAYTSENSDGGTIIAFDRDTDGRLGKIGVRVKDTRDGIWRLPRSFADGFSVLPLDEALRPMTRLLDFGRLA